MRARPVAPPIDTDNPPRWPSNGKRLRTDLTTIGPLLAYHRQRAGLTLSGLSMQSLTCSSSTLKEIESGGRQISTRNLALRLARALKLDDLDTDHFLHVAGYSTVVDWQLYARDLLDDLGMGDVYEREAAFLYSREGLNRGLR
jgi:hypothetical protein